MSDRSFLLGVVTGVLLGVLFAPESGRRTRRAMRARYFEMKDRILDDLSQIKDITKETYEGVVSSVVKGYEEAKLVTSGEAAQIRSELNNGYQRMKSLLAAAAPNK
jgi:gas vesicle protein